MTSSGPFVEGWATIGWASNENDPTYIVAVDRLISATHGEISAMSGSTDTRTIYILTVFVNGMTTYAGRKALLESCAEDIATLLRDNGADGVIYDIRHNVWIEDGRRR